MHYCTVIAKDHVAHARVLAGSLRDHNPEARMTVLVIDDVDRVIDSDVEPFELLRPADIECPEFAAMATRYEPFELATSLKPWLLRHLLSRGEAMATYLDADIQVFGPLSRLGRLGEEHGLVLTPHITAPIPADGKRPAEADIIVAGQFNAGCITVAATAQGELLLDWWSDRLRRGCIVDQPNGYFADQRWMDLMPGMVEDYALLRDPEYNVAYWNLHGHRFEHDGERYTVDGRPLAFFHFSGFDPERPDELSRHQTRFDLSHEPALARLCEGYADALKACGHDSVRSWPYAYGTLPDGAEFTRMLRRLYREGEDRGELQASPLEPDGYREFLDWLAVDDDAVPGLTRLLARLYSERTDLQRSFPDVRGADRKAYLRWARDVGVRAAGLPARLAPTETAIDEPKPVPAPPLPAVVVLATGLRGEPTWRESALPKRLAGTAVGRVLKPFIAYQRGINERALAAIEQLDASAHQQAVASSERIDQLVGWADHAVERIDAIVARLDQLEADS